MPLSMSNIAWSPGYDTEMYAFLRDNGFSALEIAPTRLFPEEPYEQSREVKLFAKELYHEYGLRISSIQSIWYGRTENMFRSADERAVLVEYTKRAVDFAAAAGCGNLVFGCPKNRNIPEGIENTHEIAAEFFTQIADYAAANAAVVALEPNPPFYGTNFINTTTEAFEFVRKIGNSGLKVNIDLGTMISYNENVLLVAENLDLVNHIHISEPKLVPIERRPLHRDIFALPFENCFSVEMANCGDLETTKNIIAYIASLAQERQS
jgi:sugar phosphate isomerase/epimerase